jgi:Tol biopolymer transport system component
VSRLALCLAIAVLAIAPAAGTASRDSASKPTGTIVYSHRFWPKDDRLFDNFELFVLELGGRPSVRLTRNPRCDEEYPSWSRSGGWIAFVARCRSVWGIYLIRADGSGRRRVVRLPNQWLAGTAWSPDDRRIAFGSRNGIRVVNVDGSGLRRLTRGWDISPTWSRDGQTIAFERQRHDLDAGELHSDVFLMRPDGTARRHLTKGGGPAWSPDGRRIAFTRGLDIWVVNPDGRGQRRLRCCRPQGVDAVGWSPDSRYLAYDGGSGLSAGIYVMPVEGTSRRFVGGGDQVVGFTWGSG